MLTVIFLLVSAFCLSTEGYSLPQDRVIGGSPADISEAPYMVVLLVFYNETYTNRHGCGGSIISPTVVVSACHCFKKYEVMGDISIYKVRAGSTNRTSGGQLVDAAKVILYQSYLEAVNQNKLLHDIALLFLKTPLEFNKNVAAVALPIQDMDVPDGTKLLLAGWGRLNVGIHGVAPEVLYKVILPKANQEKCKKVMNLTPVFRVTDKHICAGNFRDNGGCKGDSGSGLTLNNVLVGIVSYGKGTCQTGGYATVFTRVSSYIPWIKKNLAEQNVLV